MDSNIELAQAIPQAKLDVLHKPGAVRLDGYPLLVFAPINHGPGIRTEDTHQPHGGVLVSDIAMKAAEMPDYDQLAEHFGTSREHVRQAIAYAVAATAE